MSDQSDRVAVAIFLFPKWKVGKSVKKMNPALPAGLRFCFFRFKTKEMEKAPFMAWAFSFAEVRVLTKLINPVFITSSQCS